MMSRLLDPVFLSLLALAIGLVAWTRVRPRRVMLRWKIAAWGGFGLLFLASSPWCSNLLVHSLQPAPTDLAAVLAGTSVEDRALVVLAGGSRNEYDYVPPIERLDDATIARLLGGGRVYREAGGFSVVVVTGTGLPYVQAMADFLVLVGVPRERIALETQATDTLTNATYTAAILEPRKVRRIVLVTSALHMRRSVAAFARAGLEVVPAPVDYMGAEGWRLLPSSPTLHRSARAIHEVLGRLDR